MPYCRRVWCAGEDLGRIHLHALNAYGRLRCSFFPLALHLSLLFQEALVGPPPTHLFLVVVDVVIIQHSLQITPPSSCIQKLKDAFVWGNDHLSEISAPKV